MLDVFYINWKDDYGRHALLRRWNHFTGLPSFENGEYIPDDAFYQSASKDQNSTYPRDVLVLPGYGQTGKGYISTKMSFPIAGDTVVANLGFSAQPGARGGEGVVVDHFAMTC